MSIEAVSVTPDTHPTATALERQLAQDLELYLKKFTQIKFGIRVLAQKTGLNEKTIKRLSQCENKPTYQTVLKIYSALYESDDYHTIVQRTPPIVSDFIKKYSPAPKVANTKKNQNFYDMIRMQPLFGEIYVLSGIRPISRREVLQKFGEYGLEILEQLETQSIVRQTELGVYVANENGPNLDGPELKQLGEYFVRKYLKAKNTETKGQHAITFYAEGLSFEGLQNWLKLDMECFYKKLEILKDPKQRGPIPVFTFSATDTIEKESET